MSGPGLATLLGNFQVFLMALAGFAIYRERLGWQFLAGVLIAFVGLYLLVGLDWSAVSEQYRSASCSAPRRASRMRSTCCRRGTRSAPDTCGSRPRSCFA